MESKPHDHTPMKRTKDDAELSDVSGEMASKKPFPCTLFESPEQVSQAVQTQLPPVQENGCAREVDVNIEIPDGAPQWATDVFIQITDTLQQLADANDFNSTDVLGVRADLQQRDTKLKELSDTMNDSFNSLKCKISILEEENRQLRSRLQNLDRQSKKDNILIFGIPERKGETHSECLYQARRVLYQIGFAYPDEIRLLKCHRKGRFDGRPHAKPRPILIRFHWSGDREEAWYRRSLLNGSSVYFGEDYPEDVERNRKTLWPAYKRALAQRNKYNSVQLDDDKLKIDHKVYTVQNMHTLPPDLNMSDKAEKSDTATKAFFGKQSPLSNHHPAPFKLENLKYNCTEQFLMKEKALLFDDEITAHKIMVSSDPVEQKRLGKTVERSPKYSDRIWHNHAPKVMEKALQAKFVQNPSLGDWLLETGDKLLVEGTRDKFWGIGLHLQHKNILVPAAWPSDSVNTMGKLLMKTRTVLRDKQSIRQSILDPIHQSTPVK